MRPLGRRFFFLGYASIFNRQKIPGNMAHTLFLLSVRIYFYEFFLKIYLKSRFCVQNFSTQKRDFCFVYPRNKFTPRPLQCFANISHSIYNHKMLFAVFLFLTCCIFPADPGLFASLDAGLSIFDLNDEQYCKKHNLQKIDKKRNPAVFAGISSDFSLRCLEAGIFFGSQEKPAEYSISSSGFYTVQIQQYSRYIPLLFKISGKIPSIIGRLGVSAGAAAGIAFHNTRTVTRNFYGDYLLSLTDTEDNFNRTSLYMLAEAGVFFPIRDYFKIHIRGMRNFMVENNYIKMYSFTIGAEYNLFYRMRRK